MALKEDEEVSLVEDGPAQGDVGDESNAVPAPPPTLGREEKRTHPRTRSRSTLVLTDRRRRRPLVRVPP